MTVSLQIEIPEEVYEAARAYLDTHKGWDQSRLVEAGLSLFLMQNGSTQQGLGGLYLDALFDERSAA